MKVLGLVAPFALAEASQPVQILRTGQWTFPEVGTVEISKEDLVQFRDNFKNNVRRQKLPAVVEHNHDLGAFGWLNDVFLSDDGERLMADPGWTDRGKELVDSHAFKYISAELWPQWEDPETHQTHQNVLTAISMTNFPRMKEMREIAAGERMPMAVDTANVALSFAEILGTTRSDPVDPKTQNPPAPPATPPGITPPTPAPAPGDTVSLQAFAEVQASVAALKLELSEVKSQKDKLAEEIKVERQTRILLECSEKVDAAKRQGRITPAQATDYLQKLPTFTDEMREFVFADIASRPVVVPLSEVGSGGAPAAGDVGGEDQTRKALAERTQVIFAEQRKINPAFSQRDALMMASKEMRQGVTR